MGLDLTQLFLRRFDLDRFVKTVGPCWKKRIAEEPEPAHRQLVVLFNPFGVALLDSTGGLPRALAFDLSEAAGGEAVWVSVGGTALSYSVLKVVEGETIEDRTVPPPEEGGLMPWVVDAEQEAWDQMRRLRIPPRFRYLRIREIKVDTVVKGVKADMVLLERPAFGAELQHGYFSYRIENPRAEEDGPPTEYSVYKQEEKKLFDVFVIQGKLEEARVDRLLLVIDAIARRKIRPEGHSYAPLISVLPEQGVREFLKRRYAELVRTRELAFRL